MEASGAKDAYHANSATAHWHEMADIPCLKATSPPLASLSQHVAVLALVDSLCRPLCQQQRQSRLQANHLLSQLFGALLLYCQRGFGAMQLLTEEHMLALDAAAAVLLQLQADIRGTTRRGLRVCNVQNRHE